jgi:enamine deaminase RidA (YjgF/YER057c/UK114 family)
MLTLEYTPGSIEEETALTLSHVETILQTAGGKNPT